MLEFTAVNTVVMEALRFKKRRNEGKKKSPLETDKLVWCYWNP